MKLPRLALMLLVSPLWLLTYAGIFVLLGFCALCAALWQAFQDLDSFFGATHERKE
jgi:hypothetical protein